jgi:RHS repeat-associated protein
MTVAPAISAPPALRKVSAGRGGGLRALPEKGGNTVAEQKRAYTPESDQVGTISKVLDSAASVANAYEYDAFGVTRSATEVFPNPYRFAGKPLDADSDLYHFIARQYEPDLGRFASREIHSMSGSYLYALSNTVGRVDPSGLFPLSAQISVDIPQPFPNIPGVPFPRIPDPHDAGPALLKCIAKLGIDKFFEGLHFAEGEICSEICTGCERAPGPSKAAGQSGYRTIVPIPDVVSDSVVASLGKCWLNDMLSLPLQPEGTHVTMYTDNVWVYWTCAPNYYKGATVLYRARVKSTIKVGNKIVAVYWKTVKIGDCSSHLCGPMHKSMYCECCTVTKGD